MPRATTALDATRVADVGERVRAEDEHVGGVAGCDRAETVRLAQVAPPGTVWRRAARPSG
jgi:hypothetical protein